MPMKPFQHRVDEVSELQLQFLPLDVVTPLVDEFNPGVLWLVPSPFQVHPARSRGHAEARQHESVSG